MTEQVRNRSTWQIGKERAQTVLIKLSIHVEKIEITLLSHLMHSNQFQVELTYIKKEKLESFCKIIQEACSRPQAREFLR